MMRHLKNLFAREQIRDDSWREAPELILIDGKKEADNQPGMKSSDTSAGSSIPQASVDDPTLQVLQPRDWRGYFASKLIGKGLEIGPLHRPMYRNESMDMDYVDRMTVDELRAHYPELRELPLIEPTVIADAETLTGVADGVYDFLISSHVIEHMKNPLGSLEQWCRVVRPGGLIYLVVPDKRAIFDKSRVRTLLEHMILDYKYPSAERDREHFLDYIVHVHDLHGSEAVAEALETERNDYSIHFHVFIPQDIVNLVHWFSQNVRPLTIAEGPDMSPGSDEFHLLLQLQ